MGVAKREQLPGWAAQHEGPRGLNVIHQASAAANSACAVHVPACCPRPSSVLRFPGSWVALLPWNTEHLWVSKATPSGPGVPMPSGVTTHRLHEWSS